MTISYASERNLISKDLPISNTNEVPDQYVPYVRPSDWLSLPAMTSSSQAFYGLLAITNDSSNFVAISAGVSTGTVTINWGDGTSDTVASNVQVNHEYNYSAISPSTESTRGYRQVIVTITPNVGNLTGVNTQLKYVGPGAPNTGYTASARWLDIKFGSPFLNTFTISNNAPTVWHPLLEQIELTNFASTGVTLLNAFRFLVKLQNLIWPMNVPVIGSAASAFASCLSLINAPMLPFSGSGIATTGMFTLCNSLRYVPDYDFANVTSGSFVQMFNNCISLIRAPRFVNTGNISDWSQMFSGCNQLRDVPRYNVLGATTLVEMFANCRSLVTAPYMDTRNVTSFGAMFQFCNSLRNVPAYDMSNATTVTNMFNGCSVLESVPSFVMPKMVSLGSMFQSCSSLRDIGTIVTTGNLTTINGLFLSCISLDTGPAISNTSNVTTFTNVFSNCRSLTSSPVYDTSNVTFISNTFTGCTLLSNAPNIDLSKVTVAEGLFNGCVSLTNVPAYNTSNVTNTSNMFLQCTSLSTLPVLNLEKCTNAVSMFQNCSALKDGNIIANTGNITNGAGLFSSCTNLLTPASGNLFRNTNFNSMYNGCQSLLSIPAYNMSNATTAGTFINGSFEVSNLAIFGCRVNTSVNACKLDENALITVQENLGSPATTQTITIGSNPGSTTIITRTCSITTNQIVVNNTGIQAANVTVGMFAVGTGVTSALTVTVNASTNRISSATVTFPSACVGSRVSFTTTANGLTAYTIYYVIAVEFGQLKVSLTPGGSEVDITSDGSMSMNFENRVITVSANSVELTFPSSSTGTQSIAFRRLNTNIARLKNWTVTG